MPFNPSWFVDRTRELGRFRHMLAGETDERILLIMAEGEQGKSCLLLQMVLECEQQDPPVPVVLLDFDQRKSGLTDYLSVASAVRRDLGDKYTPNICACADDIYRRGPLVNIQTGAGAAGVDFGRKNRFRDTEIEKIAGRDYIRVGPVSEATPTADRLAWQKAEMGRALYRDLAGLDRVVLLVDTFEQAPPETRTWLERWLLDLLRRQLPHALLVVAGRPECRPFFDRPSLWSSLVATIDRFTPFTDEDILTHYRRRGLRIRETEIPLLLDLARSRSPAKMAQIGDWLEQSRGGAR